MATSVEKRTANTEKIIANAFRITEKADSVSFFFSCCRTEFASRASRRNLESNESTTNLLTKKKTASQSTPERLPHENQIPDETTHTSGQSQRR
jgi:hypothetical protein